MPSPVTREFTTQAIRHLQEFLGKINHCLQQLTEEQIWWRPNANSNSIGNLALHLCGNVRQWIVAGVGGAPDNRQRDSEFAEKGPVPTNQLMERLTQTVHEACQVIEHLDDDQLLTRKRIQVYDVSGVKAVIHVVEHFSYHTGQILYITKMLLDVDLAFYAELGTRQKNESCDPSK